MKLLIKLYKLLDSNRICHKSVKWEKLLFFTKLTNFYTSNLTKTRISHRSSSFFAALLDPRKRFWIALFFLCFYWNLIYMIANEMLLFEYVHYWRSFNNVGRKIIEEDCRDDKKYLLDHKAFRLKSGVILIPCLGYPRFWTIMAHMEPAQHICYNNAANDLPEAFKILNCGLLFTP